MKAKYGEDGHDNNVRQSVQPPEKDIQYYKLLEAITSAETPEGLEASKGDVIEALKNRSITQFQRENLERIIKSNQLKIKNAPPKVETNAQSDLFEKTFAQYSKGRLGDSSVDRIATMFESGEITPEQYTKLADLLKSRCESLWNQSPSDAQEWFDETLQKRNVKIARKKAAEATQTTPEQQKEKTDQALAEAQRQVKEAEAKAAAEEQAKKEAEQRAAEAEAARQAEETARKEAEKRAQEAEKQLEKSSGHEAVPIDKNVIQGYNNGSQNDGAVTSKTNEIPQKATPEQEENFKGFTNTLKMRRIDFNSKADNLKEALEHGWLTQSQADDFAELLKAKYAETKGVSAEEAQKWYDVAILGEAENQRRQEETQKAAEEAVAKLAASALRNPNPVLTSEEFVSRYQTEENKQTIEMYHQKITDLRQLRQQEINNIYAKHLYSDEERQEIDKAELKYDTLIYEASKEHTALVHKIMFPVDEPQSNNRVALSKLEIKNRNGRPVDPTDKSAVAARDALDLYGRMMDNFGIDITKRIDQLQFKIGSNGDSEYKNEDNTVKIKGQGKRWFNIPPDIIHEMFHYTEYESDKAPKIRDAAEDFWNQVTVKRNGQVVYNDMEGMHISVWNIPMPPGWDGAYARRIYSVNNGDRGHHEFIQKMLEIIAKGGAGVIRDYPEWFNGVMSILSPNNLQ